MESMIKNFSFLLPLMLHDCIASNFSLLSFCHSIPTDKGNLTFCNLTSKWKTRFSENGLYASMIIQSVMTIIILIYGLYKVPDKLYKKFKRDNDYDSLLKRRTEGKLSFFSFVLLPTGKLVWDAIDAMFDLFVFYRLEEGLIIDDVIIRNNYVINAILAFAVIGCLKILLSIYVLYNGAVHSINDPDVWGPLRWSADSEIVLAKSYNFMLVYMFEDAVELFLEYFYVEKYFTTTPPWFMITKDIIIAFIALIAIYMEFCNIKWFYSEAKESGRGRRYKSLITTIFLIIIIIGLVQFLRVGGAGYQYFTGKLHTACLGVFDGKLMQFPFAPGCLREIDYVILVLIFLPIPFTVLVVYGYKEWLLQLIEDWVLKRKRRRLDMQKTVEEKTRRQEESEMEEVINMWI